MKQRIYIITSHFLHKPLEDMAEKIETDYDISVVAYDNFLHLGDIYKKYRNEAAGFLISGRVARQSLQHIIEPNDPPMVSFDMDTTSFYATIVNLLLKNRDIDLKRIVLDFMIPVGYDITLESILPYFTNGIPSEKIEKMCNEVPPENIYTIENQIKREIIHLWNQDAFDLVISSYGSLIPEFEKHKIPYVYPVPTEELIQNIINELSLKIEISDVQKNFPAVINLIPAEKGNRNPEYIKTLQETTKKFFQDNIMDVIVDGQKDHVIVILTKYELETIIQNRKASKLTSYLKDSLKFKVCSGYGIGININDAFKNASIAQKESLFQKDDFIVDEMNTLIGPLNSSYHCVIEEHDSEEIGLIAKKAKLSSMTIRKIITCMERNNSNKMTTADLSTQFGTSVRNANRILQNLSESGLAEVVFEKNSGTKGRPVKVYKINLENK